MEESQKSSGHDEDKADAGECSRVDDANIRGVAFTASGIASIGEVFRGTSQAPEALHSQAVASARRTIAPVQASFEFLLASTDITRVASRASEVRLR